MAFVYNQTVKTGPIILDDSDVMRLLDMGEAIAIVEDCFRMKSSGALLAPPRFSAKLAAGSFVFTCGALMSRKPPIAGFRVYQTFASPSENSGQLAAVWNAATGAIDGIICGETIGAMRTGAIGGVALRYMSDPEALSCGIIGAGRQAQTQLSAAVAVRPSLRTIRVYSRNAGNRRRFCERMSSALGVQIEEAASAQEAAQADIVICATNSQVPILNPDWLKADAHVTTVGPKQARYHELSPGIHERASLIVTDSLEQLRSYEGGHFLEGTDAWDRIQDLSTLVARDSPNAWGGGLSLFCSTGLAGTEIAVASAVLNKVRATQE